MSKIDRIPSVKQQERRWKNAVSQADRINDMLDQGSLVFQKTDSGFEQIFRHEIREFRIVEIVGDDRVITRFLNHVNSASGMYDTIDEYNQQYRNLFTAKPVKFRLKIKK